MIFTKREEALLRTLDYAQEEGITDFSHLEPVDARQLLWEMMDVEWGEGGRGSPHLSEADMHRAKRVVKKLARVVSDIY